MHRPVLLQQAIESLEITKNGRYIDATFGEGGHTQEILKLGGKVLGIDWDADQIRNSKLETQNLTLVQGNFKDIEKIAKENNFCPADGILIDLGLSMRQLNNSERGFSYKKPDEMLDMRIDKKTELTGGDLINSLSEDELYEIFAKYSEELNSRLIAKNVILARRLKAIKKVGDLLSVIDSSLQRKDVKTYSRIFQAIRIAVNEEFDNLKKGLKGGMNVLKKDGRMVVISFHSLEDRIVKDFVRRNNLKQINKKIIISDSGLRFERSAKMRIISYK